jgi:hypothetical protein
MTTPAAGEALAAPVPLPEPRGALSDALLALLPGPAGPAPALVEVARAAVSTTDDPVEDDDLQLALYLAYELHYGGPDGADPGWEWEPDLLAARREVERSFEAALRDRFAGDVPEPGGLQEWFLDLTDAPGQAGRGTVAAHVARAATREQVAELLVLRSPYQLKEADPQTWVIPRLRGRAKAALVEVQCDEYGGGRPERVHATLFARAMRALGLDDRPGAHLDAVPARALAAVNAQSLLGLHARLAAAAGGHLAVVEMTSSLPSRRWVTGLQRLGLGADAVDFFAEHVEADAVHEQVVLRDLLGPLVEGRPGALAEVAWGARVSLGLDAAVGRSVLAAWEAGAGALRTPAPAVAG